MFDVGRLCIKIAGRDAGEKCVVVDIIDDHFVMIDGVTRRRKCNVKHLEPLDDTLDIKKGASHEDVAAAFKGLGIDIIEKKSKKATEKPKKVRAADRKKLAKAAAQDSGKKAAKKADDKSVKDKEPSQKSEESPADVRKEPEATELEKSVEEDK